MKKETKVLSADEYFDANFGMHYKGSEGSLKQEVTDFAKDYVNYLHQFKLNEVTDDNQISDLIYNENSPNLTEFECDKLQDIIIEHLKRTES